MDDQTSRSTSGHVVEALDASARDFAQGNVHDAESVRIAARPMLADHGRASRSRASRRRDEHDSQETEDSVGVKLGRGFFAVTFFLACPDVLELQGVRLADL